MKLLIKSIALVSLFSLASCGEGEAQEQHANSQKAEDTHEQHSEKTIAKNVNVAEFKKLIESGKGVLVDVRTPGEFNSGNIEGAKNINISGDFSNQIQKLDKNTPVYVYCRSGGRSGRAMQQMKGMGFKEVYNLSGGIGAWSRQ